MDRTPLLENILDTVGESIAVLDADWRYVYVNAGAARLLGRAASEIVGRSVWQLSPGAEAALRPRFEQALREQAPLHCRHFAAQRGLWLEVRAYPSPGCLTVHTLDITDAVRAEESLRASRDRYRVMTEAQPNIAFVNDPDGGAAYVNRRWYEFTGLSESETLGFGWVTAMHPDDRDRIAEVWAEAVREGRSVQAEYRFRGRDGAYRWFLGRAEPLEDADGNVLLFLGTMTDITDQRERERALNFLVALNDATRGLADPSDIMAAVARSLGEHLGASRCAYAEVEDDEDSFVVQGDWARGCASIVGQHRLAAFGRALPALRAGRTYVTPDAEAEAGPGEDLSGFRAAQIRAVVCVPLHKAGRLVGGMAVHQDAPRRWTPEEIALVEMVCERSWALIERARADRRLRERAAEVESLNASLSAALRRTDDRVRNNLQVLTALLEMAVPPDGGPVPAAEVDRVRRHVSTLAAVHNVLNRSAQESPDSPAVSSHALLDGLLPALQSRARPHRLRASADEFPLPASRVTALALLMSELVSEAAARSREAVGLSLTAQNDSIRLCVEGDDPAALPRPAENTGLDFCEHAARWDLRGELRFEGPCAILTFPVEEGSRQ